VVVRGKAENVPNSPLLAMVRVPSELQPRLVGVFSRVWSGTVTQVDALSSAAEAPLLAVVAGPDALGVAREQESRAPDATFLAVVAEATRLRASRGALPANVAWAIAGDELGETRFVGLALRFALEVAARRRLERRLASALGLAEVGSVAGGTAHEMANAMTGLLTNLELAVERLQAPGTPVDSSEMLDMLRDALEGARHVAAVATDLGRASARAGRLTVLDVRAVVDSAVRLGKRSLRGHEVQVSATPACTAEVDETRLCQVLLNLLRNAALALEGRPDGRIEVQVAREFGEVVIQVVDNGPGIPEAVHRRLFEPGYTGRPDGSGLGLSLSRAYLQSMGGTIELVNTSSHGTIFEVRVPAAASPVARPTLVPEGPSTHRLIVVDSAEVLRRAIERSLLGAYAVSAVASLEEAAAELDRHPVDAVFVDGDGVAPPGRVLAALRGRRFAAASVVVLVGELDAGRQTELEAAGLRCVRKPLGVEALQTLMAELRSGR
jgi:signal transduction histidine kinase/CheY-like chemotaxis protein